ncbi:MAG TPA: hypothetical protein VJU86_12470 [Pyrinomonadaceae bacterium]|nr:hypothetical protein [Pyrinomonadaceae bacterium]
MSEQQSQKRGLQSEGQKTERARDGYEAIPPSNAVAGAFGERDRNNSTDEDAASRQVAGNERPETDKE